MNRTPQSRRFWRIFGPILGYWGIQFGAQLVVSMAGIALNAQKFTEVILTATEENFIEKMSEFYMILLEQFLQHYSLVAAVLALATIPMTAILFTRDRKAERQMQLPARQMAPGRQYAWILLFGTVLCVGANVIIAMSGLAMKDVSYFSSSEKLYSEGILVMLVCQGLIIPIAEELMFRGVLFKRCREQMSFYGAAISVSCFFALIHGSITQLIYTLILGMFLAYFYEKYGSLKAPVLLHILVNSVSIIITKTGILVWLCSDFMRMAVCFIGCAFIGAVAFVRIQKIEMKTEVQVEI